jgi:fumarate hydratase subunit alpha
MITLETVSKAIYQTIKKCTCCIPDDLSAAFDDAIQRENSELGKMALQKTQANFRFAKQNDYLACSDTGWPLFYYAIGDKVQLEGGLSGLEEISRKMVAQATKDGFMRATVKHPITGSDPGNNIGSNVPNFTYKHVPGESIQVTFVSKGGGSECFGGTRYQVIAFADGVHGIEKFIIDSYIEGARGGKICPPSIIGIGIGGTADISAKLAKQAAALRLVNSKHPEPEIAELEDRLYQAINMLGIGGGLGGRVSVLGVNIEYAYSHIGGIAVSMCASCVATRRATSIIHADNVVEEKASPTWFNGR